MPADIQFYRRGQSEPETEVVLGDGMIRWAYAGDRIPFLARLFFHSAWPSKLMGAYCNSRLSRRRVAPTITHLEIDAAEFLDPADSYPTFQAFFTRRLQPDARPYDSAEDVIVAPADGRYLLFPSITERTVVPAKGCSYSLDELLACGAAVFSGGDVLVARLCPADYHRYHFPCGGRRVSSTRVPGRYHSVNPLALACGVNAFGQNLRVVNQLESEALGPFAFVEVGAFGVSGIVETHDEETFQKMDEKGYFEFGGSTVVLVFAPGVLRWDDDLVQHSAAGYETWLKVGEQIATLSG
ncbi:MAG TPA: phosphatidylserine decarboxylase [Lentisphaeria bacterium]|nr:phosphatidylserine decarboxylase [Lentisphaeria bacterium]